jgi:hypothetical protein
MAKWRRVADMAILRGLNDRSTIAAPTVARCRYGDKFYPYVPQ